MKKAYLGTLDRFGYTLTAVGKTKGEVREAIMSSYKKTYAMENDGANPAKDLFPGSDRTYLQIADEELFITQVNFGEALWL